MSERRADEAIRGTIVQWALWGAENSVQIAYDQRSDTRLTGLGNPGLLPLSTDCSAFATLCYAWAGAPNPNHEGDYDAEQGGYTGTMLAHCRRIRRSAARPADLVVWTPPPDGHHVCVVVAAGADPWLVSHGDERGPRRIRFSEEHAAQRAAGHPRAVWLTAFQRSRRRKPTSAAPPTRST